MKVKLEVIIDTKTDDVSPVAMPKEVFEYLDQSFYVDEVTLKGWEKSDDNDSVD